MPTATTIQVAPANTSRRPLLPGRHRRRNGVVTGRTRPFPKAGSAGTPGAPVSPRALHRQHRERAAEQGEDDHERRHRSHLGAGTRHDGSPFITPIAPPYSVALAPATQTDGGRVGTNVDYKVTLTNLGFNADTYTMSSTGGTWPVTFMDATCTTPLAGNATSSVPSGGSTTVCARVAVPAAAADGATSEATITATSAGDPAVSAAGSIKTIAVSVNTLLVDNDTNAPQDSQPVYKAALDSAGVQYQVWDLNVDDNIPLNYMKAFRRIVWFTGNSWPQPLGPYEAKLISYLDAGNNLFMTGQDILYQSGGTTTFAHDYLHVLWDGTETQNDKNTDNVIPSPGRHGRHRTVPLPGTFLGRTSRTGSLRSLRRSRSSRTRPRPGQQAWLVVLGRLQGRLPSVRVRAVRLGRDGRRS